MNKEQIFFETDIQFLSREAFEEVMRFDVKTWTLLQDPNKVIEAVKKELEAYDWSRVIDYFQDRKEAELDDFDISIIKRELTREALLFCQTYASNHTKKTLSI